MRQKNKNNCTFYWLIWLSFFFFFSRKLNCKRNILYLELIFKHALIWFWPRNAKRSWRRFLNSPILDVCMKSSRLQNTKAKIKQTLQKKVTKSKRWSCKQTEFNLVTCLWIMDKSKELGRSTEYRGNHNCNKIKKQISESYIEQKYWDKKKAYFPNIFKWPTSHKEN